MSYEPIDTRRPNDYTLEDCARPPRPTQSRSHLLRVCSSCGLAIEPGEPYFRIDLVITRDRQTRCVREPCAPVPADAIEVRCLARAEGICERLVPRHPQMPWWDVREELRRAAAEISDLVDIAETTDAHLVGRHESDRLVELLLDWENQLRDLAEETATSMVATELLEQAVAAWPAALRIGWFRRPKETRDA